MATIKLVLWPRKTSENTYQIKVRIAKDNETKYIPSRFAVKKSDWNPRSRTVRISHPDHVALNDELSELLNHVLEAEKTLRGQNPSASLIKDVATGKSLVGQQQESQVETIDFFTFTQQAIDRYKAGNKFANDRNTRAMLAKLKGFWSEDQLPFASMTVKFLKDYESHLQGLGKKQSTIAKDFSRMRKMIRDAVDEGIIDVAQNPFLRFKVKRGKASLKTKLSINEMRLISEYPTVPGSRTWDVISIFRFQFYTGGMRIGDALQLKWGNVVDGRLVYQMDKTDLGKSPVLVEPARKIIQAYRHGDTGPEDFIFPFLSHEKDYTDPKYLRKQVEAKTALINKYLKDIARKSGIEKAVTSHVARHSMADYLRKSKTSIYDISKILGHSSIKTTEIYLESVDAEAMDGTLKKLGEV